MSSVTAKFRVMSLRIGVFLSYGPFNSYEKSSRSFLWGWTSKVIHLQRGKVRHFVSPERTRQT